MARFNLSFLSILLMLAVLAVSVPVKRDGASPLSLDGTLSQLKGATGLMDGLTKDSKAKPDTSREDAKKQAAEIEAKVAKKMEEDREAEANGNPAPTATHSNKLSSGNFVTPTATPTQKPTTQPNALGKVPIVGGILGGSGIGL
ncbi:hypothetical protein N7457_002341 [Penicillium paradoxum]|uniref:uncharacterized protein n=1 Tax=Penicillium paradoxum TaxID=176176 RepID=UPI0025496785|nr:uncharacterized protein N7457_002341 [Penicillium paradoxum]KAJ5787351.1 hypothetical protein N7457_002341 [Penicillium paradoxum]